MIIGILLLYIGLKMGFPFLYLAGCWAVILFGLVRDLVFVINGAYKAGKNGKRRTHK